jgi:transcriptional regulator GlxA family with amidase domain
VTRSPRPHRIVFVVYDRFQSLDLAGPFEVFAMANALLQRQAYELRTASLLGGQVRSESGLTVVVDEALAEVDPRGVDTLLVAGGTGVRDALHDAELVDWIRRTGRRAPRVASVCSGAFLLAEAGLLDGRPATTHWARAERLAREYPAVDVDADPIFTRDGKVWTSAGVTAGIDLALAMVEDDHDAELAQSAARWLVMFLRRPGGQTQFAAPVWSPPADRPSLRTVQDGIHADPAADHSVAALAAAANMSERNFLRVFSREVGCTPAIYVERVRVEQARRQLEQTPDGVDVIAARCGFGTAETMRRAFIRRLGVPPADYRKRFTHTGETI